MPIGGTKAKVTGGLKSVAHVHAASRATYPYIRGAL